LAAKDLGKKPENEKGPSTRHQTGGSIRLASNFNFRVNLWRGMERGVATLNTPFQRNATRLPIPKLV